MSLFNAGRVPRIALSFINYIDRKLFIRKRSPSTEIQLNIFCNLLTDHLLLFISLLKVNSVFFILMFSDQI